MFYYTFFDNLIKDLQRYINQGYYCKVETCNDKTKGNYQMEVFQK